MIIQAQEASTLECAECRINAGWNQLAGVVKRFWRRFNIQPADTSLVTFDQPDGAPCWLLICTSIGIHVQKLYLLAYITAPLMKAGLPRKIGFFVSSLQQVFY